MIFPHSSSPSWSTSSVTQMRQFSTFWAFLDIIGPFLWLFIYCWALWGQNSYLVRYFFCKHLFSAGVLFWWHLGSFSLQSTGHTGFLLPQPVQTFQSGQTWSSSNKRPANMRPTSWTSIVLFFWDAKKTSLTESFNQPFVSSVRATIKLQDLILNGTTCVDFFPSSRNFQMSWVFIKYAS